MNRGEFLAFKRKEKGLSVSELSGLINVSEWEIERWEAGELPDSEHLLSLSSALGVSVEDILRGGEYDVGSYAFSEEVDIEGEKTQSETVAKYETNKTSDEANSNGSTVGARRRNGYSAFERKFGYVVFAVFLVAVIIMSVIRFTGVLKKDTELTFENYQDYIEILIQPAGDANSVDYIVSVTANEDIDDFYMIMQVNFIDNGHVDVFRTAVFSGDVKKGDYFESRISLSSFLFVKDYKVTSIKGGLG